MMFDHAGAVSARIAGSPPSGLYVSAGKRLVDLILLAAMAPAMVPLVALLWLLARSDGGPGFFVQRRVGKGGKTFRCFKIRTMAADAEARLAGLLASNPDLAKKWQTEQKLDPDPRVTRLGRILRRSSLDELPQVWNILRGEMSFVGPRPFLPEQRDLYEAAGGRAYYRLRPGITGPWQVMRGKSSHFVERVAFDESYHRDVSLRTDLALILRTSGVICAMNGR